MSFKPKIIGFLCNWCSYAGADLAGVSRIQYPPNIRIVRLMCSGRMEPYFVFESLMQGIDGIIIMGCHPGECHYMTGNYEAEQKYDLLRKLLDISGLSQRVNLEWVSASEGVKFGKVITDFSNKIQNLGPSPAKGLKKDADLMISLKAMQMAANDYRLKVFVGRKKMLTEVGNVYEEIIETEKFEEIEEAAVLAEYHRHKMLLLLQKEALSVESMSEKVNIGKNKILEHVTILRSKGLVDLSEIIGVTPYYIAIKQK